MAGHSKWAQIKRKKAVTDARRGKLWTSLLKEITVSARIGGGDPNGNPRLRSAVQDAKAANVPNDNIDRAIKRGTGDLEGTVLEEMTYEGYGPGGVAILVEAVTDNKNRTVADVRHLFSRHGGNLGETGCVNWMFTKRGYLAVDRAAMTEEAFVELALELEVEDLAIEEDVYEMYTAADDLERVREALREREIETVDAEVAMIPSSSVPVEAENAGGLLRLVESLEEHDDVQHVWANFDLDEETLAAQAG